MNAPFVGAEILGHLSSGELILGDEAGDELSKLVRDVPGVVTRDAAAKAIAANSAVVYEQTRYKRARRLPIGFASTAAEVSAGIPIPGTSYVLVPAGATFTVSNQPQRPFRGGRLVVPSDVAGGFILNDIKVQGQNQNPLGDNLNVPCRALQENAEAVVFHLDTSDTNSKIAIQATNISGGPLFFSAMLVGIALYELRTREGIPVWRVQFILGSFQGVIVPSHAERSLKILLDCLTGINLSYLRDNPQTPELYKAGVRYQREVPEEYAFFRGAEWVKKGTGELFRDIPEVIAKGGGDCEDLVAWRVAELRYRGVQARPTFRWQELKGGRMLYHILVNHPDGGIEDPSRALGME